MVPVTIQPIAVLCGLGLGLGLWLLVALTPRLSRPNLASRVAPYVVDISSSARELLDRRTADPLPVFGLMLEPVLGRLRWLAGILVGGTDATARRLRQAGLPWTVDTFRSRQLAWAGVGAVAAVALDLTVSLAQPVPVIAQVAFVLVAAVGGFVARDYVLQRRARARLARLAKELPTILEFMTLSLSAGEGILDALRRISRISSGELAVELGSVVAAVNTGLPLADSLVGVSRSLELPPLTRAVEQITGALERGTPLAEVLRAQAQDARDEAKRELLEVSGKKEVAMLVPLVFLILPVTILFAIFPGIFVLQVGF